MSTSPPKRRSSQRLLAASGVTSRVEIAAEAIARVVQSELRERVARLAAEAHAPLPPEALQPLLAIYHEAAAVERRRIGALMRAYTDALHDLYAATLHAVRPGVELDRPRPDPGDLVLLLAARGLDTDEREVRELCAQLGLDGVEESG